MRERAKEEGKAEGMNGEGTKGEGIKRNGFWNVRKVFVTSKDRKITRKRHIRF